MTEWYGFTPDSARRIGDVVRKVERMPVPLNRRPAKGEVFLPEDADAIDIYNAAGMQIPQYGLVQLLLSESAPVAGTVKVCRPTTPGLGLIGIATADIADATVGKAWIKGAHPFLSASSVGLGLYYRWGTGFDTFIAQTDYLGAIRGLARTGEVVNTAYGLLNGERGDTIYAYCTSGIEYKAFSCKTIIWDGFYHYQLPVTGSVPVGMEYISAGGGYGGYWYSGVHVAVFINCANPGYGARAGYLLGMPQTQPPFTISDHAIQINVANGVTYSIDDGDLMVHIGKGPNLPTGTGTGTGP